MAAEMAGQEKRKPYSAPVLRIYGSIEALTQSNTHSGNPPHADVRGAMHDVRTH